MAQPIPNSSVRTSEVADFFGDRAGGLMYETTKLLAQKGIAPICDTASFAVSTGFLLAENGEELDLPLLRHVGQLPAELRERALLANGQGPRPWVLSGELGGITENDEYLLVVLDDVPVGASLVRISCNQTRHEFTQVGKNVWVYRRQASASEGEQPARPQRSRSRESTDEQMADWERDLLTDEQGVFHG